MNKIKALSILDKDYLQWIKELSTHFRRSQVKASVKVNEVMVNPDATCFSETNLLYMKNFYLLYHPYLTITPQVVEQITQQAVEQKENSITPQLVEQIQNDLFSVPWGHHRFIIDKFKEQPEKALFFVHQTVENGWSRDMLLIGI